MTRNHFLLLLDKLFAETFVGWRALEEELTIDDVATIEMTVHALSDVAVRQILMKAIGERLEVQS